MNNSLASVYDRALAYAMATPGAVSGQRGHAQTFSLACKLVHGFALSENDAMRILEEWNDTCEPPWTEKELRHKVTSAYNAMHTKPRGYMCGNSRGTSGRSWTRRKPIKPLGNPKIVPKEETIDPYADIPVDAHPPDFRLSQPGFVRDQPSMTWPYHDKDGKKVGYIARYEKEDGNKTVRPFTWKDGKWDIGGMPQPRPLYRLPELVSNPNAVVIITEGEKAADGAQRLVPDAVAITWAGGSGAWKESDFGPLRGRIVILWPDNDACGQKAMAEVRHHLLKDVGVSSCKLITLPHGLPDKWDAADALAEGWSRENVLEMFKGFPNAPPDLCPLCWRKGIVAPPEGPTCSHTSFSWPEWSDDHPDFQEPDGSMDYDQWEASRNINNKA